MEKETVEVTSAELRKQIENINDLLQLETDGCTNEYGIEMECCLGNTGGIVFNIMIPEETDDTINIRLYPDGTYKTFIIP